MEVANRRRSLLVLALCLLPALAAAESAPPPGELAARLDELAAKAYPADQPGAAVLIVKDGKPLLRKAYGLANVELRVPNRPEHVFRIGSVTKQFTAAAILLLTERGKLALTDEITKYLPGYPTHGHKLTIEHLLTHTSGIPSYTSLLEFHGKAMLDLTHEEMMALWQDKPLDFPPGTKWQYNNSGYYLLGVIIEKVSGMPYAEFLEKNIFRPLGLAHTRYDKSEDIIPDRAAGYEEAGKKLTNASYLSMALPFAAGSLVSTVDDLARWSAALWDGKVLAKTSLQRMTTPYKLKNGESTGYGYGLGISAYEGHRVVSHSGGINGFQSDVLVLPEDRVVAVVLSNHIGGETPPPDSVTRGLAGLAIGKPVKIPVAVQLDSKIIDHYAAVYQGDGYTLTISRERDHLTMQRGGGPRIELVPLSPTEFMLKPASAMRLVFERDPSGKSTQLALQSPIRKEIAKRTDKPIPADRKAIPLGDQALERYTGRYEVVPGVVLAITRESAHLLAQLTGQPAIEIFPESESEFFCRVIDMQLTFVKDAKGELEKLILHQNGKDTPARRVK